MTQPFQYNSNTYMGDFLAGNRVRFDAGTKSSVQTDGSIDVLNRIVTLAPQEFITVDGASFRVISAEPRRDSIVTRYYLVKATPRNF